MFSSDKDPTFKRFASINNYSMLFHSPCQKRKWKVQPLLSILHIIFIENLHFYNIDAYLEMSSQALIVDRITHV